MSNKNFTLTSNKHGLMHKANPITKQFIEYAKSCHGTVLDLGSAYGVATIPILLESSDVHVIACDISQQHLDDLLAEIKRIELEKGIKLCSRLTLINKKFPYLDLEENSVDAVLASHLLPFLTGNEIEQGIFSIAKFLKPGGKFYMSSYSIYNKLMRFYIPTYEDRKQSGEHWPGELEDASLYWDKDNPLSAILPHKLNHLEPCLIEKLLLKNNFQISYLDFLTLTEELPEDMKLDGRETMGLIASQSK